MNEITKLVQNHDYITPRIVRKSGISKFKFYKYVRENELEPVSRGGIEAQDFNSVLKAYVYRKDKDLNRLMEYAKLFRVDNVIRRYMEVLL